MIKTTTSEDKLSSPVMGRRQRKWRWGRGFVHLGMNVGSLVTRGGVPTIPQWSLRNWNPAPCGQKPQGCRRIRHHGSSPPFTEEDPDSPAVLPSRAASQWPSHDWEDRKVAGNLQVTMPEAAFKGLSTPSCCQQYWGQLGTFLLRL